MELINRYIFNYHIYNCLTVNYIFLCSVPAVLPCVNCLNNFKNTSYRYIFPCGKLGGVKDTESYSCRLKHMYSKHVQAFQSINRDINPRASAYLFHYYIQKVLMDG